jgi:hypothetical protein
MEARSNKIFEDTGFHDINAQKHQHIRHSSGCTRCES